MSAAELPDPGSVVADVFAYGDATGSAAVAALSHAGWSIVPTSELEADRVALDGALGYLRDVPHAVLDERYETEALHRDLMLAIEPLARLHGIAAVHELPDFGNLGPQIRSEVLEPSKGIVGHWTSGPPWFEPVSP